MRLVTQTRSVARLIRARSESSSIKDRLSRFFISIRSILSYRVRFFLSHRYMWYGFFVVWEKREKEKQVESEVRLDGSGNLRLRERIQIRDYLRQRDSICALLWGAPCCSGFKSNCIVRREIFAGVQRCADVVIDFQRLLMVCNGMNPIAVCWNNSLFSCGLNISY